MKIGFDFDGVFVDLPPFIPAPIIDYLYKKHSSKKKKLEYRFPGIFEQKIRIASHTPILRAPKKRNIKSIDSISKRKGIETFLISSRFSFLKKRTHEWIRKNRIAQYFNQTHFNFNDEQPHIFKNRMIKTLKINMYIDDDLDLLLFLAKQHPKKRFYWLDESLLPKNVQLPENVYKISSLSELEEKHLK